jgi:hypothetical protein
LARFGLSGKAASNLDNRQYFSGVRASWTLAAWRPDLADYRNVVSAYRITLKSLGRRSASDTMI